MSGNEGKRGEQRKEEGKRCGQPGKTGEGRDTV